MKNFIVYHGSADKISEIIPRRNVRTANGVVIWDRISFHATPHRWIAIAYTRSKKAIETTGVDLYNLNPVLEVVGPATLEDALKNLYGRGGYVYHFDGGDFSSAEGLGGLELFTDKSVVPIKTERIEDPVAELQKEGVTFVFTKKENPKEG